MNEVIISLKRTQDFSFDEVRTILEDQKEVGWGVPIKLTIDDVVEKEINRSNIDTIAMEIIHALVEHGSVDLIYEVEL